ncbi:MAG: VCBS repeat-containing protein, partial [Myxococcota bacterium]|nr:VCBS repeat-containing protein [Myxococcota bacterium]
MRALPALALVLSLGWPVDAHGAPRSRQDSGRYDHDILGFNEGGPYRLEGAAAEAVLAEKGAAVFQFKGQDWMRRGEGSYVPVPQIVARFPARKASELVAVYRLDLDGDRAMDVVLVADNKTLAGTHRYAPTVLRMSADGYVPAWTTDSLPGELFHVVDARDLNGDGRPELLLSGKAGKAGYYHFHQLLGHGPKGLERLEINHVDSVHYTDLDRDGRIEIVIRERVGRRGPAYHWTYVDQLVHWDGAG